MSDSGQAEEHPLEIGPYRVLDVIGRGGMGVVYRAEEVGSGARVALKTVRLRSENLLAGIRREIRALMRVEHPGVVRVLGEGVVDGVPWYAMELVSAVCRLGASGIMVDFEPGERRWAWRRRLVANA